MHNYLRIYALAVCFVSIITTAICAGFALYNLVTLAFPEATIEPYQVQFLRSNDSFVNSPEAHSYAPPRVGPDGLVSETPASRFEGMSEAEITALREARLQQAYGDHVARARLSLLRQGIMVLVTSILFASHWMLARRLGQSS